MITRPSSWENKQTIMDIHGINTLSEQSTGHAGVNTAVSPLNSLHQKHIAAVRHMSLWKDQGVKRKTDGRGRKKTFSASPHTLLTKDRDVSGGRRRPQGLLLLSALPLLPSGPSRQSCRQNKTKITVMRCSFGKQNESASSKNKPRQS